MEQIFDNYKLSRKHFADILTSITEAVNNAIIHGNLEDETKFVKIELERKADCLIFTVSDEGKGFDPSSIPDPTLEENRECCGGRGVFLINQLSHKVNYHNNGSTVEIVFNL